jgi:hypothetical protein
MLKKSLTGIAVFLCLTMGAGISYAHVKTIKVKLWHSNPCTLGAYCKLIMQHGEEDPVIVRKGYVTKKKMEETISYDAAYDDSIGARLRGTSEESVRLCAEIIYPGAQTSWSAGSVFVGEKGMEERVVLDLSTGRFLGMPVDLNPPYI